MEPELLPTRESPSLPGNASSPSFQPEEPPAPRAVPVSSSGADAGIGPAETPEDPWARALAALQAAAAAAPDDVPDPEAVPVRHAAGRTAADAARRKPADAPSPPAKRMRASGADGGTAGKPARSGDRKAQGGKPSGRAPRQPRPAGPPVDPETLLAGLNGPQRLAASHDAGPILVVAGAGSGKTRLLTQRAAWLVAAGKVGASQILCITFTNKAAREMRERVLRALKKSGLSRDGEILCSTFHSLGMRIIRENLALCGLKPGFSLLSPAEQVSLLVQAARGRWPANKILDADALLATVSGLRNKGVSSEECPDDTPFGSRLGRIWKQYNAFKRKRNVMDFDDLLEVPVRALESSPELRERCAARWRRLMVDEFQDTNGIQLRLVRLLAGDGGNVLAVGDEDQGIYGWRGAEPENMLRFETIFPGTRVVKLEQNYRSTGAILRAANGVIARNVVRRHKTLFSALGEGELLVHHVPEDETEEPQWLAEEIKARRRDGEPLEQMAVLVRTNEDMRPYSDALSENGIPFVSAGTRTLLERPEVLSASGYLRYLCNPRDELALAQAFKVPARGAPKDLFDRVQVEDDEDPLALEHALRAYLVAADTSWGARVLQAFDVFSEARIMLAQDIPFHEAARHVLEKTGFLAEIAKAEDWRQRNIDRFLNALEIVGRRSHSDPPDEILRQIALEFPEQNDGEDLRPGVRLSTMHAAKGLEWERVYLPGLDDASFPAPKAVAEGGIEEERRLFYVALTRARKHLVLSWPRFRRRRGVLKKVELCRFLAEVPEDCWARPLGEAAEAERKADIEDFEAKIRELLGDAAGDPL